MPGISTLLTGAATNALTAFASNTVSNAVGGLVGGFVDVAGTLGTDPILVKPTRQIDEFVAQVTLDESHMDDMEITDQPVEQGSTISDHAFKRPAELTIRAGWSNSPSGESLAGSIENALPSSIAGAALGAASQALGGFAGSILGDVLNGSVASLMSGSEVSQVKDIYAKFLELQESAIPFDVYTGKRVYRNMLVKSLRTVTDSNTENALILTIVLRQVILVSAVTTESVNADDDQSDPEDTSPVEDQGDVQLDADATAYNSDAAALSLDGDDVGSDATLPQTSDSTAPDPATDPASSDAAVGGDGSLQI